jgi:DNA-binding protein H-NS
MRLTPEVLRSLRESTTNLSLQPRAGRDHAETRVFDLLDTIDALTAEAEEDDPSLLSEIRSLYRQLDEQRAAYKKLNGEWIQRCREFRTKDALQAATKLQAERDEANARSEASREKALACAPWGCRNSSHKPLRWPLCRDCQATARWEELMAFLDARNGKSCCGR